MAKSSRTLSLLLLVLLAAGGVLVLVARSPRETPASESGAAPSSRGTEEPPARTPEPPGTNRTPGEVRVASVDPGAENLDPQRVGQTAPPILGRLILPDGVPLEEQVTLLVRLGSDRARASLEPSHTLRVPVDAKGAFRFQPAPRDRWVVFALDASFLFLESEAPLDLQPSPSPLTLRPMLGALLRGTIQWEGDPPSSEQVGTASLHADGTPLPGVTHDPFEASTAVVPGGAPGEPLEDHFTFRAVPPTFEFEIGLDLPSFGSCVLPDILVSPGEVRDLLLIVPRGLVVSGRVVDADAGFLADVAIEATSQPRLPGPPPEGSRRSVVSDAEGRFRVEGLSPGWIQLAAHPLGFLPHRTELGFHDPGEHLEGIELALSSGLHVRGRILPSDTPGIVRRNLRALQEFPGGTSARVFPVDSEGRFEVAGLLPRGLRLTALGYRAPKRGQDAPRLHWITETAFPSPPTVEVHLCFDKGAVLPGRTIDTSQHIVPEFLVEATRTTPTRGSVAPIKDSIERFFSTADGRFRFAPLPSGPWVFRARTRDGTLGRPEGRALPREQDGLLLQIGLRDRPIGASLTGTVFSPAGHPVPKATVRLASGPGGNPIRTLRTDEAGTFSANALPAGSLRLSASARHFAPSIWTGISSGENDKALSLRREARILGQVLGPDGRGERGRTVEVRNRSERHLQRTQTLADGSFSFEGLPPGITQVTCPPSASEIRAALGEETLPSAYALLERRAEVELVEGESQTIRLGFPEFQGTLLSGRVFVNNAPLARAWITLRNTEGQGLGRGRSDAKGAFAIRLAVRDIPVVVSVLDPATGLSFVRSTPVGDDPFQTFDINVAAGSLTGRVVDGGGMPASGIALSARPDVAGPASGGSPIGGLTYSDSGGAFQFPLLAEGTTTVVARQYEGGSPPSTGTTTVAMAARRGIQIRARETVRGVELTLGATGSLAGQVFRMGGGSLPTVRVQAKTQRGVTVETVCQPDGSFLFAGLPAGRVSVSARAQDLLTRQSVSVEIEVGKRATTRLLLQGTGTLRVTVLAGTPPRPVERATFRIWKTEIPAVQDGPGIWTIGPIAGPYVPLRVESPEGTKQVGTMVKPGEVTELEVVLSATR